MAEAISKVSDPALRLIGARLRLLRNKRRLSAEEMGQLLGITEHAWLMYENSEVLPSLKFMAALASAGFSCDFILGRARESTNKHRPKSASKTKSPVSARLAEERQRLGLKQTDAAAACGVSREQWSRYENGAQPSAGKLAALASLGFDLLYVLEGTSREEVPAVDEIELQPGEANRHLINAHLRMLGWTTKSVAADLGVSTTSVAMVVAGRGTSQRIAGRIAQILGKSISDLWPGRYPDSVEKFCGHPAKAA